VASINREGNSRYLALKFNIEGRDMGSVVKDAIDTVKRSVPVPEGYYFAWVASSRTSSARLHASKSWFLLRCSPCSASCMRR